MQSKRKRQENVYRIRHNYSYLVSICKVDLRWHFYQEYVIDEVINEKLDLPTAIESDNIKLLLNCVINKIKNQDYERDGKDYYAIFSEGLNSINQQFIVVHLDATEIPEQIPEDDISEDKSQIRFKAPNELDEMMKVCQKSARDYKSFMDKMTLLESNSNDQLAILKSLDNPTKEYILYNMKRNNPHVPLDYKSQTGVQQPPQQPTLPPLSDRGDVPVTSDETDRIAHYLAIDCVNFMAGEKQAPSSHRIDMECAASLRSCMAEIVKGNDDKLTGYITKLRTEVNGFETLCNVANYMFGFTPDHHQTGVAGQQEEGHHGRKDKEMINWGRIVALYAFGGYLAMYCRVCRDREVENMISDYLGFYVSTKLGLWIDKKGGWVSNLCSYVFFSLNYPSP